MTVMKGVACKVFWHCPCCCADCHHVWCIQFALQFVQISASVHARGNACVPSYVITIGRPEVTVLFEKWAVCLQNVHSVKSVAGIVKLRLVRRSCHTSTVPACVHTPQRVCFLSGSEDLVSLVSIFNLGLF